jgi:CubicO group peptidase (beta-lactamase class C family)
VQLFPLTLANPPEAGIRPEQIDKLEALIGAHLAEGRYPGAQIAIARHGKLVMERSFGRASMGQRGSAHDDSLWLLYSNTKVITAVALWALFEQGAFLFTDRMSDHVPEFARNGKRDITVLQVITHQGGFPTAEVPQAVWTDHALLRRVVCDFALEWAPGSRVAYHGSSAHWALAVLIEALTGQDFRDVIRERVIMPLGLANEMYVGLPEREYYRAAEMHEPVPGGVTPLGLQNSPAFRAAGVPGGGGYATARAMAALYQMMLNGGALGPARVIGERTIAYALRNRTGDRIDEFMKMPMHRALGPHLRGSTETIRGLGAAAGPRVFGHGGAGTSYCWADPVSGVSFAYLTNCRIPDPWHSRRLDLVSNIVHAAII